MNKPPPVAQQAAWLGLVLPIRISGSTSHAASAAYTPRRSFPSPITRRCHCSLNSRRPYIKADRRTISIVSDTVRQIDHVAKLPPFAASQSFGDTGGHPFASPQAGGFLRPFDL